MDRGAQHGQGDGDPGGSAALGAVAHAAVGGLPDAGGVALRGARDGRRRTLGTAGRAADVRVGTVSGARGGSGPDAGPDRNLRAPGAALSRQLPRP